MTNRKSFILTVVIIAQLTTFVYASEEEKISYVIDALMQSTAAQSDAVANNITVQNYSELQSKEWIWPNPTTDYYKKFALRRKNNRASKYLWDFFNEEKLPVWALSTDYLDRSMRFINGIQNRVESMEIQEEGSVITGNLELRYNPPGNHLGIDIASKDTAGFEPNNSGSGSISVPSTETSTSINSI